MSANPVLSSRPGLFSLIPLPHYAHRFHSHLQCAQFLQRSKSSWQTCARSFGGGRGGDLNNNDDDGPIDIDALAARLASEAARLQSELGSMSSSTDSEEETDALARQPSPPPPPDESDDFGAPFGLETKAQEADILAAVGDGGFSASEFELLQELGQISIQRVEESMFSGGSGQRSARAAVIAYTASYYSGMPFQDPVVCLLKEYLPGAKAVALNELKILKHLCGLPAVESKWHVASAYLSNNPPIVELLGYFLAGPSERAAIADPTLREEAVDGDTIWIVQKWEGMAPLTLYPSAQQTSGFGLGRLFGGNSAAERDRNRMLRSITAGALRALGFAHDRGVIHGSIGSGSLLLSTFNDAESARVIVKLDNFGFARRIVLLPPSSRSSLDTKSTNPEDALVPTPRALDNDDSPLVLGLRGDRRQLTVVLMECFLSALSTQGASNFTSAEAVQRVLGEVFEWDVQRYRQYVEDEPEWKAAVALLSANDDAGWELIRMMVEGGGEVSTTQLAYENEFCQF